MTDTNRFYTGTMDINKALEIVKANFDDYFSEGLTIYDLELDYTRREYYIEY